MGRESHMQVMVVAIVILQDGKAKRRDDECTQCGDEESCDESHEDQSDEEAKWQRGKQRS